MATSRHRQLKKAGRHGLLSSKPKQPSASVAPSAEDALPSESQIASSPNSNEPTTADSCLETIDALVQSAIESSPAVSSDQAISTDGTASTEPSQPKDTSPSTAAQHQLWLDAVDSKLNTLIAQSQAWERERLEIEQLRSDLQSAIETAESRLHETETDAGKNRIVELETQLTEANLENERLATLLLNARNEYQDLLTFIESESFEEDESNDGDEGDDSDEDDVDWDAEFEAMETELRLEISQLQEQIAFLQKELADVRSQPLSVSGEEAELRIQIEKLRAQLLEARHEAVETRLQNNELSSSLAKLKGPADGQRSEVLTWEQRKEALLRQLEAETHGDEPCDPRKVLEIERVIHQTNEEIERRDREIADLRSLLEQQAIAHNGMAVGVAAVAEMIESDAMIIAERMRLQELQQEWEQKQRQAEIEMSLERAKLARERLDLQEKLQNFESSHPPQTEEEKKVIKEKGRGRWLARLGLRDEA
jgi:regulator of replication initiation timing